MEEEERALPSSAFGMLLRRHRLAAGLSQEALAERARMSTNGIGALERGDRRTPQHETLALLAKALVLGAEERRAFEAAAARPALVRPRNGVSSVSPPDAGSFRSNNLPLSRQTLVGRETEVPEIIELIQTARLVTLTGAGGIGKTSTALEVGSMLLDRMDARVWFVDLAPLRDGSLVAATIARALEVQEAPNRPLLETLLAYLKTEKTLLILDNCEHVIKEAAIVANAMLHACPELRILATSREPLRIAGERTYRLPSLGVPSPDAAGRLAAAEAVKYGAIELFVDRAQAGDHRFALRDNNASIVADICRRLDGIPLAIELAAARVKMLSPQQLCEQLDERFRVLTGGRRDVLPRQQTLRALLDWSYDLLDERERALMRRLGVFVNGFTLEGAVAVGSGQGIDELDVFDVFASLVDKSLVLAEPDGDALRYRMLESTRAYAREKLEAAGELAGSVGRHLRYLRDLFAATRTRFEHSGRFAEIEELLVAELEDVRVALDGVTASAGPEMGAELLAAIGSAWLWIGLVSEGSSRLERFISLSPADERRLTSVLWTAFSWVGSNHTVRGREAASIAVDLARGANDPAVLAYALTSYAHSLDRPGTFEDAAAVLTEAQALAPAENVELRLSILKVRAGLGLCGDLPATAQAYIQLRKMHLELGNVPGANAVTLDLADVEHQRGQTEKAVALAQEMLPTIRIGRHRILLLYILARLCGYLVALNRLSEARAVAQETFEKFAEHHRDHTCVTEVIEHTALTIALDGDVRRGALLAGYTEAAFSRDTFPRGYCEQTTRTRLEALLREHLAPAERESLLDAGAALSPEDAIALALQSPDT
jgi:predicted ATPase/transcriptional regulator with XRE-family HTH domain